MKKPQLFLIPLLLASALHAAPLQQDISNGFAAYGDGDWTSAVLFLRKAVDAPGSASDETHFVLIRSEFFAGQYAQAAADCDEFLRRFDGSAYAPLVQYHKGRALQALGRSEEAILTLSAFCHENPASPLYAAALYWIAEAFYGEYNLDTARALYERVVHEFPEDPKAVDAQYKIEMIDRRAREEKLLYLLRVTGEENLSAREDYDRQLRMYESEGNLSARRELEDARTKITGLEAELESEKQRNGENESEISRLLGEQETLREDMKKQRAVDEELDALKAKARFLQYLLDEQEHKKK